MSDFYKLQERHRWEFGLRLFPYMRRTWVDPDPEQVIAMIETKGLEETIDSGAIRPARAKTYRRYAQETTWESAAASAKNDLLRDKWYRTVRESGVRLYPRGRAWRGLAIGIIWLYGFIPFGAACGFAWIYHHLSSRVSGLQPRTEVAGLAYFVALLTTLVLLSLLEYKRNPQYREEWLGFLGIRSGAAQFKRKSLI